CASDQDTKDPRKREQYFAVRFKPNDPCYQRRPCKKKYDRTFCEKTNPDCGKKEIAPNLPAVIHCFPERHHHKAYCEQQRHVRRNYAYVKKEFGNRKQNKSRNNNIEVKTRCKRFHQPDQ